MGISALLILLTQVFTIVVSVVTITYSYQYRQTRSMAFMRAATLTYIVVAFCILGVYISTDFETKVLFSRMRYFGYAFTAPLWLLFFSENFRVIPVFHKKWVAGLVLCPGFVIVAMTLVPATRSLIIKDFEPVTVLGFALLKFRCNTAYFFLLAWVSVCAFLTFGTAAYSALKGDQTIRSKLFLLLFIGIIVYAGEVLITAYGTSLRWLMAPSWGYPIQSLLIFYLTTKHKFLDTAGLSHRNVFQHFPEPVFVFNLQGNLIDQNAQGLTVAAKCAPSSDKKDLRRWVEGLLTQETNVVSVRDSRGEIVYHLHLEDLIDEVDVAGKVLFLEDVTEANKEINHHKNRSKFKSQLLRVVSHDLAGSLNASAQAASLLTQPKGAADSAISSLAQSVISSRDLVTNISAWAKIQSGHDFKPDKDIHLVRDLIEESIVYVNSKAKLKDVKFDLRLKSEPKVYADGEMLCSAFRNILMNAIRANQPRILFS